MFLNNFQSFMTDNPSALWQSQLLQRKVRLIRLVMRFTVSKSISLNR